MSPPYIYLDTEHYAILTYFYIIILIQLQDYI